MAVNPLLCLLTFKSSLYCCLPESKLPDPVTSLKTRLRSLTIELYPTVARPAVAARAGRVRVRGRKVRVNMIRVVWCGVFLMLLVWMTKEGEVRYRRLVSVRFGLEREDSLAHILTVCFQGYGLP